MRQNFYEMLAQRKFDARKEFSTLWTLFCIEKCYYTGFGGGYPMAVWADQKVFRNLPFRGSFATLKEMMDELGIEAHATVDIEKLLLFCELIAAVLPQQGIAYEENLAKQRKTIFENIHYILERTNHKWEKTQNDRLIIVEKNKAATLAAQLVTNATIAFNLIEYNHFAIKGHLEEKKAILVSVASYIEPILNSRMLSTAGYKQLESNAGFAFNNLHIRHNNKEGSKANDYIATINSTDLEEWYDKAYAIALSVIIISDYLSIEKDIADLKPKYVWKT